MRKHTQEPWPTFINCCEPSTPVPDSEPIVRLGFDDYNMARACVNACKGMAKSDLDNMVMIGETLLDRFGMFNGEIAELKRQRDELLAALQGMIDIANDSQGVAGYHLNGEVADWGEFEEWQAACDAIAKTKGGAANHFPEVTKMAPDGLWQLVPVEPTSKMRDAFRCAQEQWEEGEYYAPDHQWQAMLAAAPKLGGE